MATGPTQMAGQENQSSRWAPRPRVAQCIRLSIALMPILVSIALGFAAASTFPPERLGLNRWIWWLGLIAIAAIAVRSTEGALRRFTPLSMLFRMSLAFPDQTPSRFSTALRSGTVTQTKKRVREIQEGGRALTGDDAISAQMLDLITMLSRHDRMTRGHAERVRSYAELIAEEMGIKNFDLERLRWAALLHDMGKLEVPTEILNKKGRPDQDEWEILARHPAAAERHLEPIAEWLGEWRHAADGHHERWDGGGYPLGLAGVDIPLAARIVAVADAYDVMTSVRSYKKAMSSEMARSEVASNAGSQFDPVVCRAFLRIGLGDLRRVAGPVAWIASLPAFRQVPLAPVAQPIVTAFGVAIATVTTAIVGLAPIPEQADPPASVAFVDDSTTTTAPATSTPALTENGETSTTTVADLLSPGTTGVPTTTGTAETPSSIAPTSSAALPNSTTPTSPTASPNSTVPATGASTTTTSTSTSTSTTTTTTTTAAPNQPPAISPASFTVSESSANGTLVGSLAVSDPDGDPLTVEIAASSNPNLDGDAASAFSATYDAATGEINISINDTGDTDAGLAGQITNLNMIVSDTAGNQTPVSSTITTASRFTPSANIGNVVITEVDWSSDGDEFIEILNIGAGSVNIGGWLLADYGFGMDTPEVKSSPGEPLAGGSFSGTFPGGSVLSPGERAVLWINGPNTATPQAAVETSAGFSGWELVRSDDIWLFDQSGHLVAYMAYGDASKQDFDNEIGDRPPISLWNLWDPSFETSLGTGPIISRGDSISLTVETLVGSRQSACWEPTTSGISVGRCSGAATSIDSDASLGTFRSSPGTANT